VITVVVDDLAFVDADAILRPSDERLGPITPVIARLDEQGGPRFATLRTVQSPLRAGAAVVTGSGNLTAPFVVHLILQDELDPGDRASVQRALRSAWQQAAAWQLDRLAAPLIGTGPGRLADEEAAELLASSFADAAADADGPRSLLIVVEREADREAIAALIRRYDR
jgi:O-acetyl-ADP-ribose deacetylase (regulator of RNase III)